MTRATAAPSPNAVPRWAVRPADSDTPPLTCPLLLARVAAGFPSPAEDYVERELNLHELAVARPAATYFVRADGESMTGAGIYPHDVLVVDRSLRAVPGKVVVVELGDGFAVKRLRVDADGPWLESANPRYPPIRPGEGEAFRVWGVVTFVLHRLG